MQAIWAISASIRRNNLTGVNGLRQLVDLLIATNANALSICLNNASHIKRHFFGLQLQVAKQMVIYVLHLLSPLGIARVRLALMHQNALNNAIILSLLCQSDERLVGVIVVIGEYARHPARNLLQVALDTIGHETFNLNASYGHMNHTNFDVLGQGSHKSTTKPIGWRQTRIGTAKRSNSFAPLALLATTLSIVHSRHQEESRSRTGDILLLRFRCTFHIRLPEAKEDVEIRIWSLSLQT